jgi:riboflavin kinase/FMN adenylyltransferase
LGRELGYPTANIAVADSLEMADGVYAAWVEVAGRRYGAMANLGVKPTFGGEAGATQRVLELHLFDFSGDLYGREVTAELCRFIRPEHRFSSPEELRARIEKDEEIIKNLL